MNNECIIFDKLISKLVENTIYEFEKSHSYDNISNLHIDMSECRFVEVTSLIILAEYVYKLDLADIEVHFSLPIEDSEKIEKMNKEEKAKEKRKVDSIISFMYAWEFNTIIAQIFYTEFEILLTNESFARVSQVTKEKHYLNYYNNYGYYLQSDDMYHKHLVGLTKAGFFKLKMRRCNRVNLYSEYKNGANVQIAQVISSLVFQAIYCAI